MNCLNPRTVSLKSVVYNSPRSYAAFRASASKYKTLVPTLSQDVVVPCGKCANCMRKRQDQFAARAQKEAEARGSMSFVTLTYREDTLPLAKSLWVADRETGEYFQYRSSEILWSPRGNSPLSSPYHEVFKGIRPSRKPRFFEAPIETFSSLSDQYDFYVRITPTVCRSDVRYWLKNARVMYERQFGHKIPEFTYSLIPEYGLKHCRPHYHILFFGLSKHDTDWLASTWEYGSTDARFVDHVNEDGSNGFTKCARYVSKYMCKGNYESSAVDSRCCEKPRICQSKNLGKSILPVIKSYVHCFDIYGEYDPMTLRLTTGERLDDLQLAVILEEIPKRLSLRLSPTFSTPLPKCFINDLFKYKVKKSSVRKRSDGSFAICDTTSLRSTAIWSLVVDALHRDAVLSDQREFELFKNRHPDRSINEICSLYADYQKKTRELANRSREKSFIKIYQKSKF